jgi:hypothetical protein
LIRILQRRSLSRGIQWLVGHESVARKRLVEASCNVMAHAQKPDFVFRRNGRVHLNRRGRQFSRLLAAEVCASAVVMLDTPCSEVVWRVLATHSIREFPLHFPSRASPCAITFQLEFTNKDGLHHPNVKLRMGVRRHCNIFVETCVNSKDSSLFDSISLQNRALQSYNLVAFFRCGMEKPFAVVFVPLLRK